MPSARPVARPRPSAVVCARPGVGRRRRSYAAGLSAAVVVALGACSAPAPGPGTTATSGSAVATSTRSTTTSAAPSSSTSTTRTTATTDARAACVTTLVGDLSPAERAGQLLMVGLDANAGTSSLDRLVAARHLGGVILLGGWYDGASDVRRTTRHLASLAGQQTTGGLGLLLAADQEGGAVQQLRGPGFTRFPSAREQATSARQVTAVARTMAKQLKAAGINVNLAPVADTVPKDVGRSNAPIGRWGREFSSDPETVATMVTAFVRGTQAGGVASTVKHFPGIGRITGNTDLTASGITDRVTTMTDPYLGPFESGIAAGADLVMVGSAIYSRLDPGTNAVFSKAIVTDLLRERLGYDGVVITDDVGAAKAVGAVPAAERATRFIAAGGDIVLTARPSTVAPMHEAITARMAKDAGFAKQVEAAATRVVELKATMGLAPCP